MDILDSITKKCCRELSNPQIEYMSNHLAERKSPWFSPGHQTTDFMPRVKLYYHYKLYGRALVWKSSTDYRRLLQTTSTLCTHLWKAEELMQVHHCLEQCSLGDDCQSSWVKGLDPLGSEPQWCQMGEAGQDGQFQLKRTVVLI